MRCKREDNRDGGKRQMLKHAAFDGPPVHWNISDGAAQAVLHGTKHLPTKVSQKYTDGRGWRTVANDDASRARTRAVR